MGFEKFFNCAGCVEITLILRDYKTVTGRLIDLKDDRNPLPYLCPGIQPDHKKDKCDDKKKDDKCCERCEFILLELTRDAESVSLQEVEINGTLEIEWVNVEFPRGSCIAVNVCDIIYAGANAEIDEEEVEIGIATAANTDTTEPTEP